MSLGRQLCPEISALRTHHYWAESHVRAGSSVVIPPPSACRPATALAGTRCQRRDSGAQFGCLSRCPVRLVPHRLLYTRPVYQHCLCPQRWPFTIRSHFSGPRNTRLVWQALPHNALPWSGLDKGLRGTGTPLLPFAGLPAIMREAHTKSMINADHAIGSQGTHALSCQWGVWLPVCDFGATFRDTCCRNTVEAPLRGLATQHALM